MAIENIEQIALFDYAALDSDTRIFVQEKAQSIHARLKRTAEDIIAIGLDLIEVKARLGHGQFLPWLDSEFGMTRMSAHNFMRVAERFPEPKCKNVLHLPASVLYELAAPSMPESVIQMVETGQIAPTLSAIREAKHELQQESIIPQQFLDDVFPGFVQLEPSPDVVDHENKERRDAHVLRVMGSSESNEWYTPQDIIERVTACFGVIDLDPCSNSHESPAVPARTLYTQDDDGLAHTWQGKTYLNPPFGGEIGAWVEKLVQEHECGNVEEAIALLPARIDTHWFQPLYAYPMCNVRGRIQYANSPYHAPFPCVVVYLGRTPGKFIATFKDLGPIMGRIG